MPKTLLARVRASVMGIYFSPSLLWNDNARDDNNNNNNKRMAS